MLGSSRVTAQLAASQEVTVISCTKACSLKIVTRSMASMDKVQTVQNEELTRKCINWESDDGR
jgi:hypothetical protein